MPSTSSEPVTLAAFVDTVLAARDGMFRASVVQWFKDSDVDALEDIEDVQPGKLRFATGVSAGLEGAVPKSCASTTSPWGSAKRDILIGPPTLSLSLSPPSRACRT